MSLYLRLELGPFFLELGRLAAEEEEPEPEEPRPQTLMHNDTPILVDAPRPGFRIVGSDGDIATDV